MRRSNLGLHKRVHSRFEPGLRHFLEPQLVNARILVGIFDLHAAFGDRLGEIPPGAQMSRLPWVIG